MNTTRTIGTTRALSELVLVARAQRGRAYECGLVVVSMRLDLVAHTLDAARTRLVQDGTEYLTEAECFVDAARVAIANYMLAIEGYLYRPFSREAGR